MAASETNWNRPITIFVNTLTMRLLHYYIIIYLQENFKVTTIPELFRSTKSGFLQAWRYKTNRCYLSQRIYWFWIEKDVKDCSGIFDLAVVPIASNNLHRFLKAILELILNIVTYQDIAKASISSQQK